MKRICKKCNIEKDVEDFLKSNACQIYRCKACERIRTSKRDRQKENERLRNYYKKKSEEDPTYYNKRYIKYKNNILKNIKSYENKNPEYQKQWQRNQRINFPEKTAARNAIRYDISRGYITKPNCCEKCGKESDKIDAHHENYLYRRDIIWLCRPCHAIADRLRKKREKKCLSPIIPAIVSKL